ACTQAMLECLSLDERLAIMLTEVLGADDELGAKLCETNPAAYRKRLSRARSKLHPVLERLCGLADPALPCRCARQARAKQLAGETARTWTRLPLVDDAAAIVGRDALVEKHDALRELRQLGPIFAHPHPIAPSESSVSELLARLRSALR